jgi:hypothetical protein
MGLLAITTFALRASSISWVYNTVSGSIPIAIHTKASLNKGLSLAHNIDRDTTSKNMITESSLAIVLTRKAFYFGTAKSFSDDYSNIRNKIYIEHLNDAPQVDLLKKTITTWSKAEQYKLDRNVILIPSDEIPMPVIIQVMASLKKDGQFAQIVLGNGLI